MLKVVAKQGTQQHQLSIPADAKVQALHDALEKATGVFARKMKLVFKGKVLDPARGAADQKVVEGAKLMMLASDGSVATKGQIAAQSVKQQQQAEAAAKVKSAFDSARGIAPQASTQTLSHIKSQSTPTVADKICWDQRRSNWQKTGIISLRDLGLDKLPGSVISEGGDMLGSAKLADMSCNRLSSLPASVSMLTALHTLKLSSNQLDDGGMPWDSLAQLTALTNLELEGNRLEQIPDNSLSAFTSLKRLNLKSNMLVAIPQGMGALKQLEGLCVDNNCLKTLPDELGECCNLVELLATDNNISLLPRAFSSLKKLNILRLNNNLIGSVPPQLLMEGTSLHTLSLNGNPITVEVFRATKGFESYDTRRRAKCTKQLEGRAMFDSSKSFAEGADEAEWSHWGTQKKK